MPSNTLKQFSRSFAKIEFLPAETHLMVLVKPMADLDQQLVQHLRSNLLTQNKKQGNFIEIILFETLFMNLHGVTQGKFQNCNCAVPALSITVQSVNSAYTAISQAYEKRNGGSVFINVYFEDKDGFWKPLNALREQVDKTYDSEIKQAFRNAFIKLSKSDRVDLLPDMLNWATQDSNERIIDSLKRLDINNLQKLNALIGLSHLQNILDLWNKNQDNADEEFWQKMLTENSFVLSQVFSVPVIMFEGKVYMGGKGFSNTGGKVIDFLYANQLTKNTALIEIKTPKTKILGSRYRDDVYAPSPEISGALIQIANYRNILLKKFDSIKSESSKKDIEAFNPLCLLIVGNMQKEFSDVTQQHSFELFRQNQREVQIITFDELFTKIKMLVDLIEGNTFTS
jgi:hypothetical protein